MHEILYLQLGNLPNFIGTHFWNAQNAYAGEEVDNSVSWSIKEITKGGKKEVVLRPRVLIFDKRGNFGPLQNMAVDPGSDTLESTDITKSWNGLTQTLAEERIPPSTYLARLEDEDPSSEEEEEVRPPKSTEVRYWSDYNHVYFSRDSLHPIPLALQSGHEGADIVGWADGANLFEMYDKEHELMDDSLRRLTEDCDSLQGFQTISHVPSFGAFGITLLQKITDEYPKCGKLNFTILGDYAQIWDARNYTAQSGSDLLSNTLSLYQLSQLSDITVPLLPRSMWSDSGWRDLIPGLENTYYHTSAVYAAHIESITWPIRQRNAGRGLDAIVRTLNRDGITPFSCLEGNFPVDSEPKWESRLELSLPKMKISQTGELLASYNVLRVPTTYEPPTDSSNHGGANQKRRNSAPNEDILLRNLYPIPLSHPQFFAPLAPSEEGSRSIQEASVRSSLNVLSSFGKVLACHADWADGYVRRGGDLRSAAIDSDEIKEVIEGMRAIIEVYTVDTEDDGGEGQADVRAVGRPLDPALYLPSSE